ncbi:hypothetical protein GIW41_01930 [Pseudomonas sp. PA-6-1D]|uniref:hypothetical protein n=1 Tax=Pseudomonas TaxID=286 RepID=UPI001EF0A6C9|nr:MULTISPECIES: hypothetical protein [Pseudomonas]MCF5140235.1 hypothetical protein [Pseudomonas sp. PA-6-3C]MCF5145418.1 hypothetical protein [Pseudomonas sp. PA-6-3F]MCF5157732.1 hypothetical protein [Pseudomonas sp. PA-6-2E]MCF5174005.1 hypothetical protein [Pseudomonas sp. PA-6-1D]MCF5191882.1 hypothetical protein [Pseudomonas sp. PA-6-1H]
MYRRIFLQSAQGFGANLVSHESEPMVRNTLSCTFIFSSIGDALSRAYDSAKETVSDVADKVADTVSDAYDATRETVGNVADAVSDTASNVYSSTVETLSDAAETVGDAVSNGYDATRDYVGDVVSGDKEIDYLKVLGGAAIGVGAIAAAPFTGGGSLVGGATLLGSLAGAGTIAAAVGAGVAGAVVAANLDGDEQARKAGFDAGVKQAKAEQLAEISVLRDHLEKAMESLKAAGNHFNAIIALNAVAIATAQCDGDITPSERANIELFINGLAADAIPEAVKAKIESLYQQPPTVKEVFELAKKSGMSLSIFDEIIHLVVLSDDIVHPQEAAFIQAWNSQKTA